MEGFFSLSTVAGVKPPGAFPRCGSCGLFKTCKSPKMPYSGRGDKGILVVGEAPGATEDDRGTQFVGKAGHRLRQAMQAVGLSLDNDCWKHNAIICRPPGNTTPTDAQIDACLPNLVNTINDLQPRIIVPLGQVAVKAVVRAKRSWQDAVDGMARWAGWQIPDQSLNAWVCPTWHPSYVAREERNQPLQLWFQRHIAAITTLPDSPPWPDGPPDWAKDITIVHEPTRAAAMIRKITQHARLAAYDIEADRLKPDNPARRCVCASICADGRRTIAYPWHGDAITATREFLASPIGKIGANNKFEDRWTLATFGHPVRNWAWDTVDGAHCLDNRAGITSLKFQSYVRLGMPTYNAHLDDLLAADATDEISRSRAPNRIDQVAIGDLLLYNGLDSLLAYKLAHIQAADFGGYVL